MVGQITFDDYLADKNREYSKTCRHCVNGNCYIQKGILRAPEQCPCDSYEVRKSCFENGIPCTGQTSKYKGLSKCLSLEDGFCYRYCFNPGVSTKNDPDKYEPSKKERVSRNGKVK